ncbi:SRPBCC family protein [uncultured Paracoccus sp.]|uniref:SRPBCC family protein n=1 Tax=uncultured Paracoccus sp. TaxID=189685 RepID=UPI0026130BB8|nr:SRPBCC family protein [uncultured Paracoccus sp.]
MKFSTRHDSDVPAEALFDAVSDFARAERLLVRRGAQVRRVTDAELAWDIAFDLRGRPRDLRLAVTRLDRPEVIALEGRGELFDLHLVITVISLARSRSRLVVEVEAKPRNLRARLAMQTARLAKPQLDRQFARRIGRFMSEIAARPVG